MPNTMPAIGYANMNGMATHHNYYSQSQKRWLNSAAVNTASMMAGQLAPGRVMTDLCMATLVTLYPSTQPGSERVSTLRCFVQAVLDAAAVSADVVILALYYLRQASSNNEAPLMSKVVDANGICIDGSDSMTSLQYLSGEEDTPATQLRVRFVAALTCAHKFDADAAYTTRTWADLGGLNTAVVVRAERELLAQLDFVLNVSRDTLYTFREEINQWMVTSAMEQQAAVYTTTITNEKPAVANYACQRMQGMIMGRCGCVSCAAYMAANNSESVSPNTSPSSFHHHMWSAQANYGYDMSWPATPTNAFSFAPDDYFAASRYAYAHASVVAAAAASAAHSNNGGSAPYYSMPQPYQSQEASPVTYAAPTAVMAMPEPQSSVWQAAANGCYSHAAMADYSNHFDMAFPANTAAMMPQPVAFYAY